MSVPEQHPTVITLSSEALLPGRGWGRRHTHQIMGTGQALRDLGTAGAAEDPACAYLSSSSPAGWCVVQLPQEM